MNKQVAAVDEKLAAMVEADEEMKRLCTMPSVGAASKPLWEWASRIEAKRGRKVAAVALARKTAGILFAMLRDKAPAAFLDDGVDDGEAQSRA